MEDSILRDFHPVVRGWFVRRFGQLTPAQALGWPSIAAGQNTLILAPTGSGKTLAAFLWAINHLVDQKVREKLDPGVRILYVSPLKALNNDIERNLREPLAGIREEAERLGVPLPALRAAVRTGDTPQSERSRMVSHPPDILITTPESLYLMLTSGRARTMFRSVQYVIVDEIHALCGNKRGVHLSLSLERLQEAAEQEFVRIGLSATQKPLERIAAYLGGQDWDNGDDDRGGVPSGTPDGTEVPSYDKAKAIDTSRRTIDDGQPKRLTPRKVAIIDTGGRKQTDLRVSCPVADFSLLPDEGAWPAIYEELLQEIRTHRTTLVFVNNRRLAERIAARLNEMLTGEAESMVNDRAVPVVTDRRELEAVDGRREPELVVQAYHGSMAREARETMEAALKAGELRALIATSSLELGIDIGSIDLVVQVQSPKGVGRGLQRIGRSGHLVHAGSKGRIIPTHREDLVEAAVVARAMLDHDVEPTSVPENCLDVLAQQIAAMVAVEEQQVDRLYDLVRRSYCYRSLSRALFDGVLDMLAGRYTEEAFRELRARISWDKVNNVLRALPGTSHLAITSGGTIADRGYFGVYLEDGKTRVGEVDEEFVYESRPGDTFILGSSVWRISDIDRNRVVVTPAPGQPARMPFWKGEGIGRSAVLGEKVGTFRRTLAGMIDRDDCLAWLRRELPLDDNAAWNILEYFRRQRDVTGVIPHDRLLVVESFRDEIGDPRLVVHSPFGRSVNGLLGLLLGRRLRERTGIEAQMLYNDDGVLLRTSDRNELPLDLFEGVSVEEGRRVILEEVLSSPLFAGQFRQNAARALLMPKVAPGKRTPLWLQRMRAGD
ncbi:MAG TPA: DEAD/DEAH box helicase, partial [Bacteroidota bacterium]